MPLTDMLLRSAKPTDSIQKLSDGGGLQLWIMPKGAKLWRLAYRAGGRQKLLALGPYPLVTLAEARMKRDDAKRLLLQGIDPGEQRQSAKASKAIADANTFAVIAAELLDKKRREKRAAQTLLKTEWLLGFANEALAAMPITGISAVDVLGVLRKVEARGKLETARRLRSVIGEVFRYAIATGRATNDPTGALRGALVAPTVTHRAAITDPVRLGALMRAIDGFEGQPTTIAALKLMAYLFPRPGELRFAEWPEFDMAGAVWTIPATRAKMRREHRVPLPPQALEILRSLQAITGTTGLVFQGNGKRGQGGKPIERRPVSENTLNAALRRLGYAKEEMSAHGFRAAASTLLNESGKFHPDAIERALAHQEKDAVRKAYARGQFWTERVTLMAWWADTIDAMRASNS